MNMISKDEYREHIFEQYDAKLDELLEDLDYLKEEISKAVKSGDNDRYDLMLGRYAYDRWHHEPVNPNYDKKWSEAYDDCEKVARACNVNFETEWVDNQTVLVKGPFKTLSSACKIIAALAELHSGMFSFESSFSEHEAYTKSGHRITIGGYGDRVKISLKLVK